MRIRKLDLYIFTELARPFAGTCVFFFFTFFLFQTLRLSDFLIVHHVPPGLVGKIALCLLVSFANLVFPVAFLAAVIIGMGRLSSDSELVALKSSGVSTDRIAAPAVAFALMVTLLSLTITLEIAPWGERALQYALFKVANSKVSNSIRAKTFNNGFYDLLLYADEVNAATNELKRVFVYDERETSQPAVIVAKSGVTQRVRHGIDSDASVSEILLKLSEGSIHRLPLTLTDSYTRVDFEHYSLYLRLDSRDFGEASAPKMLSVRHLRERIRAYGPNTQEHWDAATEFWRRIATSLTPLFYAFLGIGLGVIRTRATSTIGILLTLVTAMGYWEVLAYSIGYANSGRLPAPLALNIANFCVGLVALITYRRARW